MGGYACVCWRAGTGAAVNIEIRINEEATLVGATSVGETGEEIKFDPLRQRERMWTYDLYDEGDLNLQETVD